MSDNWMNKAERRRVHSMGAQLVSRVYAHWSDLPDRPFRLLTHMALVCKDATPKPTYWGGRDAMCQSLGLPIGADSSHQMVKRAIRRLTDSGAIKRVREGHAGARSEYELTLARGYSSDPLRGNSDDPHRGYSDDPAGGTQMTPQGTTLGGTEENREEDKILTDSTTEGDLPPLSKASSEVRRALAIARARAEKARAS